MKSLTPARFSIIALMLVLIPAMSHANEPVKAPSFSYLEIEYIAAGDIEISNRRLSAEVDIDGFAVTGSVELGPLFFQASRFELDSDTVLSSSLEDSITTVALGVNFDLPRTTIYGLARARQDDLTVRGTLGGFVDEDIEEESVGFEAGIRVNVARNLELNAHIGSPALDEGTAIGFGAQIKLSKNLGVNFKYNSINVEDDDLEADLNLASVSLRLNF